MKRFVLLSAFALSTVGVFAQGTILFANTSSSLVVWRSGTPVAAQYGIKVGLYWKWGNYNEDFLLVSPTPVVGMSSTGVTNAALDGRFNGGTVTVPGLAAGESGTFQIRAWSGEFDSYKAAAAGGAMLVWQSYWFQNPTGGAIDPVTKIPGVPANLMLPENLRIPEPSGPLLASLGLGVFLVVFRKRF